MRLISHPVKISYFGRKADVNDRRLIQNCAKLAFCKFHTCSNHTSKKAVSPEKNSSSLSEPNAATETKTSVDHLSGRGNSSYCLDLVRKHEYESFLCGLLLKGLDIRSFVFAVRSFNVEIALIRDQVSQKDIGVGRLSFWRNAINKIFQHKSSKQDSTVDVPRHPVVLELRRVLKNKNVSKKWFTNLMDAREYVLNDTAFRDLQELETYCDKSVSPILYLGFEALGIKNLDVDHACSHLGKAIGLTNFIRSIPYNAQRRRVLFPQELLVKHKLSQENLIRFTNTEKIADAIFEVASQANAHYKKASALRTSIPKEGLPLTLIGTPTEIYLQRLEKFQFNAYDAHLNKRNSWLPIQLLYRRTTGKYY